MTNTLGELTYAGTHYAEWPRTHPLVVHKQKLGLLRSGLLMAPSSFVYVVPVPVQSYLNQGASTINFYISTAND